MSTQFRIVKLDETGQYIIGVLLPFGFMPCLMFNNYNDFRDFTKLCQTAVNDPDPGWDKKLADEIETILEDADGMADKAD